jgi:hypothetical protein
MHLAGIDDTNEKADHEIIKRGVKMYKDGF